MGANARVAVCVCVSLCRTRNLNGFLLLKDDAFKNALPGAAAAAAKRSLMSTIFLFSFVLCSHLTNECFLISSADRHKYHNNK